jgi:superfamily I DNA/RNA helicase
MSVSEQDSWKPRGISDLEPNAWQALKSLKNTCIVAGPGSGKTEFLAQRAAYLLQTGKCPYPFRILAISFKTDAATNLADRVRKRCTPEQARRFNSVTFDAFTKSLVDRFHKAIPSVFRPTSPYEVAFPKRRDYEDFLTHARVSAKKEWQAEIASLSATSFEMQGVGMSRLSSAEPQTAPEFAINLWWRERLRKGNKSFLSFVMLNRLAEEVVRVNPQICRALNITYPFIFLDEFQDTTFAQYDFLLSVFKDSKAILTAVGDDKQRIMAWAGARIDAFERFKQDFDADRIPLLSNYRSSPDLVRIQQVVANALESGTVATVSQVVKKIDDEAAQIWTFKDEAAEASYIGQWIVSDMSARQLSPRDYAILVRQTSDTFETALEAPLLKVGLKLRNESKAIGKTSLQDLLSEDLTILTISLLKLITAKRAPAEWKSVMESMTFLRNTNLDDENAGDRIQSELTSFLTKIRKALNGKKPSETVARQVGQELFNFFDLKAVARSIPRYTSKDNLLIDTEAFLEYLAISARDAGTWLECLNNFEGTDRVPLMTVHKSKGLEYDTILLIGLDDNTWWSYNPKNPEGTATFFVALSRAKQRAIFTHCQKRGNRKKISDLYQLLSQAGVSELEL